MMQTNTSTSRLIRSLLCIIAISATALAETRSPPNALMCIPGELLFSEDFNPETVSDRWGFKADFALRDGALLRTDVDPTETKRVFLKDPAFHNSIIRFDFKISGQTTDLRLVTGSGGHYNSVTQIRHDHFEVNTPVDRAAGIVPAHLGECIRKPKPDQWQTMTVEYWNDEVVAYLDHREFVLGQHPIINRTREYFAFQFDLPGASIDNVRVWRANGQRGSWRKTLAILSAIQAERDPVNRNPIDRYKYEYTNLKSRLTLQNQTYRDLVAKHDRLQTSLHADYAEAFASHKQLSKLIAKRKQDIKQNAPNFRPMETAVHKAERAEDNYVLSTKPELKKLKAPGTPKQRFVSELGQVRIELEAAGDKQLAAFVAETAKRQIAIETRFPEAFKNVDDAVAKRKAIRTSLNGDSEFQARNRAVVDAGRAIKDYEKEAAPYLAQLEAASKADIESPKASKER